MCGSIAIYTLYTRCGSVAIYTLYTRCGSIAIYTLCTIFMFEMVLFLYIHHKKGVVLRLYYFYIYIIDKV